MPRTNIIETHAIFGGTFDPVHYGHLMVAQAIQKKFHFHKFVFLPCKEPVHKNQAKASSEQRISMLKLALQDISIENSAIDLSEIQRQTPSYMIETLIEYRRNHQKPISIVLVVGYDAFLHLSNWHRAQEILEYCHLLVVNRPSSSNKHDQFLQNIMQQSLTTDQSKLKTYEAGYIFVFEAGSYDISSTEIRSTHKALLKDKWLSASVKKYIKQHQIY